jgi:cyclopropane fatty-acyl-phospholipid synthase-like methyltransferase
VWTQCTGRRFKRVLRSPNFRPHYTYFLKLWRCLFLKSRDVFKKKKTKSEFETLFPLLLDSKRCYVVVRRYTLGGYAR